MHITHRKVFDGATVAVSAAILGFVLAFQQHSINQISHLCFSILSNLTSSNTSDTRLISETQNLCSQVNNGPVAVTIAGTLLVLAGAGTLNTMLAVRKIRAFEVRMLADPLGAPRVQLRHLLAQTIWGTIAILALGGCFMRLFQAVWLR